MLARRDLDKGLAATEREVLENAKTTLASELAVVEGTGLEEAAKRIETVVTERITAS